MQFSNVSLDSFRGWTQVRGYKHPNVIACECPHCRTKSNFAAPGINVIDLGATFSSTCPGCSNRVQFSLFFGKSDTTGVHEPVVALIFPGVRTQFSSTEFGVEVPVPLARAIKTAVDSYNAGIYPAVAVAGRRALEGVFKYLLPEQDRKRSLFQMITLVSEKNDLAKPLTELAHAIRAGGNLGAHFDEEREPDEQMARQLVELLDYMVNFLYILPKKISEVEQKIAAKNVDSDLQE